MGAIEKMAVKGIIVFKSVCGGFLIGRAGGRLEERVVKIVFEVLVDRVEKK